jgi:hypothetical protein
MHSQVGHTSLKPGGGCLRYLSLYFATASLNVTLRAESYCSKLIPAYRIRV